MQDNMAGVAPRRRDFEGLWELDWLRIVSFATSSPVRLCHTGYRLFPTVASPFGSCLWLSFVVFSSLTPYAVYLKRCLFRVSGLPLVKKIQLPYYTSESISQHPFDLIIPLYGVDLP